MGCRERDLLLLAFNTAKAALSRLIEQHEGSANGGIFELSQEALLAARAAHDEAALALEAHEKLHGCGPRSNRFISAMIPPCRATLSI